MDIIRDRTKGTLVLSQENYLEKVLKSFGMSEAKEVTTPTSTQFKLKSLTKDQKEEEGRHMENIPYASAVGSLMYAMVGSRPDLGFAVGLVSRFMSEPGKEHWSGVKWVLRYLKGATRRSLTFTKHSKFSIEGFCDSDYATDLDRRRSVTGYVFQVWGLRIPYHGGVADEIERERAKDLEVKSISIEAVKGGEGKGSGVRATSELWRRGFADRLHHRFEEDKELDDGD
ncbi:hypothetical protein YC2023_021784 [Brassica napus]